METDSQELTAALGRIRTAAERIESGIRSTPTVLSHTFSESAGCEVFLKLENLQRTGAFKIRGALNRILTLPADVRARGLVAASAGNHAQGVALAARSVGAPATIVMPEKTPLLKIRRTEEYGAKILLHGSSWDESHRRALAIAEERGLTLVHPFDDPFVIDGQGTIGPEILDAVPDVDVILVPVGGGGLLAGVLLAVKALAPHVRVIGVQASGASPMARSFEAGERVHEPIPRTLADGIRVGTFGELTWEIIREYVDDIVTVTDDELTLAVVQAIEKSKVVAETAGAAGMAALMAGRVDVDRSTRVCAIVSGGNIDLTLLVRVIESGLTAEGYYHLIKIRMDDSPGGLRRVMDVIAERGGNIVDVTHHRAGWAVPVGAADVDVLIEARAPEAGAETEAALAQAGFQLRADE